MQIDKSYQVRLLEKKRVMYATKPTTLFACFSIKCLDTDDIMVYRIPLHRTEKAIQFLVRRDESPENYCHSPGVVGGVVVVVVVVVRRQKL